MDTVNESLLKLFSKKFNVAAVPIFCSFEVLCAYVHKPEEVTIDALNDLKGLGYISGYDINAVTHYITIHVTEKVMELRNQQSGG